MRCIKVVVLLALIGGCTKPNPNRCCTDEADCSAKGIPAGSICGGGLVCRGNQCIAEPCALSSECDGAAPYCVAGLCAETCSTDDQCPGFGESGLPFCVSGACVACRTSADCSDPSHAVCEGGVCRACNSDAECASEACDVDSGTCIAETAIVYAKPNGSMTSACTRTDPCALDRAVSVVDPTRTSLKLAPAMYGDLNVAQGFALTIYGPATVTAVNVGNGGGTTMVRDLHVDGVISCGRSSQLTPKPAIDLLRVSTSQVANQSNINDCNATLRQVSIQIPGTLNGPALVLGTGAFVLDRCSIDGGLSGVSLTGVGTTLMMTNSIFRNQSGSSIVYGSSVGSSSISFSTFYNSPLQCLNGNTRFSFKNNIFLNERSGAPADTVTGTECVHSHDLIKPQAATPAGSNNFLNVDPRFVDGANGNLHLQAGSPAIDVADQSVPDAVDFEGTTRPQGSGRDIGAFEYKP